MAVIGDKIPEVTFKQRVGDTTPDGGGCPIDGEWQDLSTSELFDNKKVVVFSLPGAFTPTCSTLQVPGFDENYEKFKELGVDEVYVISVNDAFVMNAWVDCMNIKNIKPLPDGNAEFTEQMGMLVAKQNLGFGLRSWRYAMVVDNGEITALFEEPGQAFNVEEDPYGETTPEKVLEFLQQ